MAKYCLRKRGVRESPYGGPPADLIWELDDERNYVGSYYGWPKRYPFGTYTLRYRGEDGHWRNGGELSDRLLTVRIRDVKCKWDSQKKVIEQDLAEGTIDGLW